MEFVWISRWSWAVLRRWHGRWTCTEATWPSATQRSSSSTSSNGWWRWPPAWPSVSGGGCRTSSPMCTHRCCRSVPKMHEDFFLFLCWKAPFRLTQQSGSREERWRGSQFIVISTWRDACQEIIRCSETLCCWVTADNGLYLPLALSIL